MGFADGYKTYSPEVEGYGDPQQWRSNFFERMSPDEAFKVLNSEDPYVILNIRRNSTLGQIKKAFKELIFRWHPDRNPDQVEKATAMSQKITAAYCYLTQ